MLFLLEKAESIPVGYDKPAMMYSPDFEEFLRARGFTGDAVGYPKGFYIGKKLGG